MSKTDFSKLVTELANVFTHRELGKMLNTDHSNISHLKKGSVPTGQLVLDIVEMHTKYVVNGEVK